MKNVKLIVILFIMYLNGASQDTKISKENELGITFGTFTTINNDNKITISPAISGYLGDYYFENRYNYEADNSASVNVGKRVFKKLKHVEVVPMVGLIFGSFRGVTSELQTMGYCSKWIFSTDNQFSFEYRQPDKSFYFNWTMAIFKLTNSFNIGVTTILDKHANMDIVFDKGITAAMGLRKWGLRFYAFNFEKEKRYYWVSVRYNIKVKLISK